MAKSKFEYVREFESDDKLLPGCWIVVRVDGKGFTKFCEIHSFQKPNDERGLHLMDKAAQGVMVEFSDVKLAYGESDEYSFVLARETTLYGRRRSKIVSQFASCFTATYVRFWGDVFPDKPLQATPIFDARAVCYPSNTNLRDYLSWRQADTHINNQYNTCFWALVKSGLTRQQAQHRLKGTVAAEKNELLFSEFGINYNNLPASFRKGSVVVRQRQAQVVKLVDGRPVERLVSGTSVLHIDIIGDDFWKEYGILDAGRSEH